MSIARKKKMVDLEQPISHGVNCMIVKNNVLFAHFYANILAARVKPTIKL